MSWDAVVSDSWAQGMVSPLAILCLAWKCLSSLSAASGQGDLPQPAELVLCLHYRTVMVHFKSPGAPWPECMWSKSAFLWTQRCSGPPESKCNLECDSDWGLNPSMIHSKLTSRGSLGCRYSTYRPPCRVGEVIGRRATELCSDK